MLLRSTLFHEYVTSKQFCMHPTFAGLNIGICHGHLKLSSTSVISSPNETSFIIFSPSFWRSFIFFSRVFRWEKGTARYYVSTKLNPRCRWIAVACTCTFAHVSLCARTHVRISVRAYAERGKRRKSKEIRTRAKNEKDERELCLGMEQLRLSWTKDLRSWVSPSWSMLLSIEIAFCILRVERFFEWICVFVMQTLHVPLRKYRLIPRVCAWLSSRQRTNHDTTAPRREYNNEHFIVKFVFPKIVFSLCQCDTFFSVGFYCWITSAGFFFGRYERKFSNNFHR